MKKSILIALALLFVPMIWAKQMAQATEAERYAQEVRERYAPDLRVAIYDVTIASEQTLVVISGKTNLPEAYQALVQFAHDHGYSANSLALLPASDIGEYSYGYITIPTSSMRREPRYPAELLTQALLGTPVRIWERASNWIRIQTPDGYLGWVTESDVVAMTRTQSVERCAKRQVIVTTASGRCYSAASFSSRPVSDISVGCILHVLGETDGFYHVQYPDGRIGFIHQSDATPVERWVRSIKATGASIIEKAYAYMGVSYLWGGTSSRALDCSGYTKLVYWEHGYILPRDASQQALCGTPVTLNASYDQLQPGDLLFFGSQLNRITHVGLYIGNKEFIHESGDIHINSLDSLSPLYTERYAKTLQSVRRIIGSGHTKGYSTIKTNPFYNQKP